MKVGIVLLVLGVALLFVSIPLSILGIIGGVNRLVAGDLSGGWLAFASLVGVLVGLLMTGIGAVRTFKE
jgi:hypothetical protein